MKRTRLPFIMNITMPEENEQETGIRISAIAGIHDGNYKGVLIWGLIAGTSSYFANLHGICAAGILAGTSKLKGILASGILFYADSVYEVALGGINAISENLNGLSCGLINLAFMNDRIAFWKKKNTPT